MAGATSTKRTDTSRQAENRTTRTASPTRRVNDNLHENAITAAIRNGIFSSAAPAYPGQIIPQQRFPQNIPAPTPNPRITTNPTTTSPSPTKPKTQEQINAEVIAQLQQPGGLAGLFNGRRPLPEGVIKK